MEEVWKQIEGTIYCVSNLGNIKNSKTGRVIALNLCGKYPTFDMYNGKHNGVLVHRAMMKAFVPNPLNLPEVNHKDENPLNNFIFVNPDGSVDLEKSNLEWCDRQYNNNYGTRNERVSSKKSKPVIQLKNGVPVFIWKSQLEAAQMLAEQNNSGNIYTCLKGKTKQAYGFEWKYF
jgi:hypothetical protein